MKIPVANIYYLLAYAWDKLEESRLAQVNAAACSTPLDLLAKVLANGTAYLFKKGLDRNYREQEAVLPAIKGKLLVAGSVKELAFQRGKALCNFDEFDYDVLHNRILKTMMGRLQNAKGLDDNVLREVRLLRNRFHEVSEVTLSKPLFRRVQLHRNNHFYAFLLNICELLFDNLLPDERTGQYHFREFWKDDAQMPSLFEAFVRNFYRRELKGKYRVSKEYIRWQFAASDDAAYALLPRMETDVVLRNASRKIIIDTKYYKDVLTQRFEEGVQKLRREHLSQLFSYLKNQISDDPISARAEGVLLYATAGLKMQVDFMSEGHRLAVRSVDLSGDWKQIRAELMAVCGV